MRKKIVAGNWKMHGTRCDADSLVETIKNGSKAFAPKMEVVVFPSFVHLQLVENLLTGTLVSWGAQNIYLGTQGAFTGEVSGPMLVDYGCTYVLIGHSERRILFKEDLDLVAAKFKTALEFRVTPVLCIGESFEQREKQETEQVLTEQLESVIRSAGIDAFRHAVIAYEPIWAIGTGLTASPQQAQDVHAFIRKLLMKHDTNVANGMRILYGGSVKADNAAGLFAMPDIDGGLVGGASLDAKSFLAICEAAL